MKYVYNPVHPTRKMIYYLCGFDPQTPLSGERCSLTGIKIGRAAFSTIINASTKKEEWIHPFGHTHSVTALC
jgi:hypothetical protein